MTDRTETLTALVRKWEIEASQLKEAAAGLDIGGEEYCINLYMAWRLSQCIRELDAMIASQL